MCPQTVYSGMIPSSSSSTCCLQELDLLALLLQRGVEEVEVEHGSDDVLLHPGVLQEVLLDDALLDELVGFLHELVVVLGGEESPLELLHLVVDLDYGEAVDVLGLLDLLGEGHARLFEEPVVVPLVSPLLRPEQVPAAHHGHGEVVLDGVDAAVGDEGPVGDEEDVVVHQALLDLGLQDAVELVQHHGLVDHAADEVPLGVPLGPEVLRERGVPSLLAHGHGPESLGNGSIASVKGGMGGDNSNLGFLEVVFLKVAENLVSADHVESLGGLSCPNII